MVDTVRTIADLQSILADNSSGDISPQDVRDLLVSSMPHIVHKTADESVSASTTLQNDDHLTFTIDANTTWLVDAWLFVDGATAGDIKVHVAGPTSCLGKFWVGGPATNATSGTNRSSNGTVSTINSNTGLDVGTLGSGTNSLVQVHASVRNQGNAGSVTIQWAQRASNATATRVRQDSFLIAHRIA